ncbi:MAG: DUF433 domain-containing protein [Armatimonadetes bacterium]|nr:DUF433 domain-containing protein [Armatimonadota bacterium]
MSATVMTEYRYIICSPAICGNRPTIQGTRTPIKTIVGYYKMGLSVEEILEGLPHLTAAQVYEALSYYHDHQAEIERDIEESQVENLLERYGLRITHDGRIAPHGNGNS